MRIRRKKTILEQAADYVEAAVEGAVEKAGPILADAKDAAVAKAGPALVDARDKASPLIAQSAARAAEKASQARDLATEKAAEVAGKPRKKHRLRRLLLLTGIAAAIGFVVKRMQSRDSENWQSSYTPPPPPRDADRTDTPIADAAAAKAAAAVSTDGADEGGAGPDEALADAVDETHDVTTPDEPADVVDLESSEEAGNKSGKN
jgi:hypothetical protein